MKVSDLATPALVVNFNKVKRNASVMRKRCEEYGVRLRPHFKTTKVVQVAELQTGGTKRGVVVSTLPEAELLAENGFDDILYAYPFPKCHNKIERCSSLNKKLSAFHVEVDSLQRVEDVISLSNTSEMKWSVFITVDCGYHRDGVSATSNEVIEMARRLHEADNIDFQGLYTHCGNSYFAQSKLALEKVADNTISELLKTVERLKSLGIECKNYGLGSTPTCSQPSESMRNVTEWHPGCYIFYDLQQQILGGCALEDIAAVVATRVIGHMQQDGCNHILIDCGWTALTLQGEGKVPSGGYGGIVNHPELKLYGMSQEIGKVTTVDGSRLDFAKYPIGSILSVYPYHACTTCSMHPVYYVVDDDDKIVDEWKPARGW